MRAHVQYSGMSVMTGTASISCGVCTYLIAAMHRTGPDGSVSSIWWYWMLPSVLLMLVTLITSIVHVRHAYTRNACAPCVLQRCIAPQRVIAEGYSIGPPRRFGRTMRSS